TVAGVSTIAPLIAIRPSAIMRSISRREAIPARASSLAMRSPSRGSPDAGSGAATAGRAARIGPRRGEVRALRPDAGGLAGGFGGIGQRLALDRQKGNRWYENRIIGPALCSRSEPPHPI